MLAFPAQALSLLRDPDIENALSRIARPILNASGLSTATKILVVDSDTMNAFVVDRNAIYIHAGLLMGAGSAEELQFVIAHEAAHILNGHLERRQLNAEAAGRISNIGMALAVAAAAGTGQAAAAAAGIGVASSARGAYLSHTRAEEASADLTAIRNMAFAGVGTQGAVDMAQRMANQVNGVESDINPYARSHPLSTERLKTLAELADRYGRAPKVPQTENAYWFDRAQGKASAFLRAPAWTEARADRSVSPDIALMRRAVAHHRQADWRSADRLMDQAIALRPEDPYYYELKGQILLEGRQFAAAEAAYRKAEALSPYDTLILASLGHALVVQGGTERLNDAVVLLERARMYDRYNRAVLRDLGAAYAQLGQPGQAALASAEGYAMIDRMDDAALQAGRAAGLLPRGSPGWQRAQDVLNAADAARARR